LPPGSEKFGPREAAEDSKSLQGGNKGLIVNSRNLCNHKSKVAADLEAHSGKRAELKPALRSRCGKGRRAKRG
jgi:hypothetical protein